MNASSRAARIRRPSSRFAAAASVAAALFALATVVSACADDAGTSSPVLAPNAAPLVQLPEGYGIDRTEITRAQYAAWLANDASPSSSRAACATKESFEPDARCLQQFDRYVCQGEDCGEHPQVCVDWCDAQAYCEAAGKRLCGSIGGGATPFARGNARPAGAPLGQWENACSAAGKTRFPYGDAPRAEACNTSEGGRGTTAKVGEMSACQSTVDGYRDVLDLSGNAWEWEDACEDETADAFCHVRGGSFNSETALDECSAVHTYHRDFASYFVGFRCCAD